MEKEISQEQENKKMDMEDNEGEKGNENPSRIDVEVT
jgi:hypothetical protein